MANVDVFDKEGRRLISYEINIRAMNYKVDEAEFIQHARENARDDRIVPENELPHLTFRVRD